MDWCDAMQETRVLQTVDRLKIKAAREWKLEREYRRLQLMSLPKRCVTPTRSDPILSCLTPGTWMPSTWMSAFALSLTLEHEVTVIRVWL